jgi:pilus assembly protein CpaF
MSTALRAIVDRRLNFLISGATGTGKTTLLAALLSLSAPHERLVTVEDSAELTPAHPHVVGLQSRHGNLEGSGSVDLADLVRQALRMRPDRLIVGECRGAEVRELLAAMNTGHDGAGGTIHANSAASVPARLSALAALAGMEPASLALQAVNALDVVIHVVRAGAGRTVSEIGIVEKAPGGELVVRTALARDGAASQRGPAWEMLAAKLDRGR